jgi:hypothetical protein
VTNGQRPRPGFGEHGLTVALFLVSLALPLLQEPAMWPITAVGGVVSALLLWGALRDEAVAGPVVGLVATAGLAMLLGDAPAVAALLSVVVAIVLGEHLAMAQHRRYHTPTGTAPPVDLRSAALHGAIAAGAIAVALAASVLPSARIWSAAAVVAAGLVAWLVQRRRAALGASPLPPPEIVAR